MKKRAFTLAEAVITLILIGVIAAIMLPGLKNFMPNNEQVMFKKAYHLTGRVINEMVNDDDMYPDNPDSDKAQFFAYAEPVKIKGKWYPYEATNTDSDKTNPNNLKKFCLLFAQSMNITTKLDCSAHSVMTQGQPVAENNYTFKTADGMVWQLPITDFGAENSDIDRYYNIVVDVNGDKGGNCFEGQNDCIKPDRFIMQVNHEGRFTVPGSIAQDYLNRKDTTEDYKSLKDKQEKAKNDSSNNSGVTPYESLKDAVSDLSPQGSTSYTNTGAEGDISFEDDIPSGDSISPSEGGGGSSSDRSLLDKLYCAIAYPFDPSCRKR